MNKLWFLCLIFSLFALPSCSDQSADQNYKEGYSDGWRDGLVRGRDIGYQKGYAAAQPPSDPGFSKTTRLLVGIAAVVAALKLMAGLMWCIFQLIRSSEDKFTELARSLAALLAAGAAFLAVAFLSVDHALTAIFLSHAWKSPLALLFIVGLSAGLGYFLGRAIYWLASGLEGDVVQVFAVATLSFIASVIGHSYVTVFRASAPLTAYMFSYLMIGSLVGVVILLIQLLLHESRKQRRLRANASR